MRIKHFIFLISLIFLCSCSIQKYNNDIIYFLPTSVTEIISTELKDPKYKNPYLVMDIYNEDRYIVYVCRGTPPIFVKYSNRAVFIDNKLIPLYFGSDEAFAYANKGKEVLRNIKSEKELRKVTYIRENTFSIQFNFLGEIIP